MVSGVTGEGLPELLAELDRLGAQVPPRAAYPATRMPVDRVFSLKGIGTVVTGTLWSGSLSAEDTVAILPPAAGGARPALREVRVRSIQVHDHEVAAAAGGQRVALNLTGVDRDEVDRGQWVVKDPAIEPTYLADVRLTLLSDAPGPLPRVSAARVDHGTAEVLAKVVLADQETSGAGRVLLRPVAVRGAGAGLSGRPVHRPLGDSGDHHRRGPGDRPGAAQARHRARSGTSAWPSWRREPPDAIAALLLEEAFPSALIRGRLEASPYLWRFAAAEIGAAVAGLLADGRAVVPPARRGAGCPAGRERCAARRRRRRAGPSAPALPRPLAARA